MGIEKVVPTWRDLEVFLQLLPRSSHRRADEPVHLDVDRRDARRRPAGVPPRPARQRPHRHARRPGRPRGAALHPLLGLPERLPGLRADRRPRVRLGLPGPDRRGPVAAAHRASPRTPSLPFASTLCGACYDVCPVAIDIPTMLVHLRGAGRPEKAAAAPGPHRGGARRCAAPRGRCATPRRWRVALRGGAAPGRRARPAAAHPGPAAAAAVAVDREPRPAGTAAQTFRDWWARRDGGAGVAVMTPREEVLGRIRQRAGRPTGRADGAARVPARRHGSRGRADASSTCSRSGSPTTARRCTAARPATPRRPCARSLARHRVQRVVVPDGFPADWLAPATVDVVGDDPALTHGRPRRGRRGRHHLRGRRSPRPARSCWTAAPARAPRAHPGARLPPRRRARRPGRRRRPGRPRPARPAAPADLDQRPERHQRHRARPGRGRARPAPPRGGRLSADAHPARAAPAAASTASANAAIEGTSSPGVTSAGVRASRPSPGWS